MSALLIDIGNSRLRVARRQVAAPPVRLYEAPSQPDDRAALVRHVAGLREVGERVGIVSVVPAVTSELVAVMPDAEVVDHTWALPFGVAIRGPETVGGDRWCNVAGAVDAGLRDVLVVDAGTATTIDVLDDGIFVGGLIAPGMAFAARALQESGARLWPVEFAEVPLRPGRDTDEALAVGAFHVGVQGVRGTVAALLAERPDARVLLTGGLARYLERPGWVHDPDLTFRGLAALLAAR